MLLLLHVSAVNIEQKDSYSNGKAKRNKNI